MNKTRGALHLTQQVDYGILLLATLANTGKDSLKAKKEPTNTSIKQIAEENNLSFLFLQKIAQKLLKAKLIKSERGKFGGYKLTKKPEKITLKEIIEALEGKISVVPCLMANASCCKKNKKCAIKNQLSIINKEMENFFLSKTLATFTK
ncbi:Rrf2 family transcriptional regulator [Candidatus Gracilibacteria bacterium]|jgi:Rrf2 family protein|nr:Rrf2 family transcriptional regulator [Candidatus Gracilibacteria bacterium]